ncbi:hypothetical protein DFH06DRAFT_1174906 [Mycena polygramma]|nr:hypothetical protein DFH06DRAFT_1174906 [Mycena polygramma]
MWSSGAPCLTRPQGFDNIRFLLLGSVLSIGWSALFSDFFSSPGLWAGLPGLGVIDMTLIFVEVIRKSQPSRF